MTEIVDGTVVDDAPAADVVVHVPHPKTGEVVAIIAATPTDQLAELRDAIVEHEKTVIKQWKDAVDAEIVRRLDFEGRRSAEVGRWKVTVPGPVRTVWDSRAAYLAVQRLVRAGLISAERGREAVRREVSYVHQHGSLSQLAKHADERVRVAIDACRSEEEVDTRRVSVTPRRVGA
jgi:hypothetical protein